MQRVATLLTGILLAAVSFPALAENMPLKRTETLLLKRYAQGTATEQAWTTCLNICGNTYTICLKGAITSGCAQQNDICVRNCNSTYGRR